MVSDENTSKNRFNPSTPGFTYLCPVWTKFDSKISRDRRFYYKCRFYESVDIRSLTKVEKSIVDNIGSLNFCYFFIKCDNSTQT